MAFEIKSGKTFKFVIGTSALFISTMAAVFSVTGVATLFSGYFITVALMMGGLEFGKVIVASFMARYWKKLNYLFRFYFVLALIILITITSGGIFGYLSDGYQKTKGSFDVSEKEVVFITSKIDMFTSQKKQLDDRIQTISNSRKGQEARLDSLYSRKQLAPAKGVEQYIQQSSKDLDELSKKSMIYGDSISKYSMQKLEKENKNATGELGPLKYLAKIFNTDMDTIVKYFILMLIFVFDPLAILLFVSLNVILKDEENEIAIIETNNENFLKKNGKKLFESIANMKSKKLLENKKEITEHVSLPQLTESSIEETPDDVTDETDYSEPDNSSEDIDMDLFNELIETPEPDLALDQDEILEDTIETIPDDSEMITEEQISNTIDMTNDVPEVVDISTEDGIDIESESNITIENDTVNDVVMDNSDEHAFYHDRPIQIDWHSSNIPAGLIAKIDTELKNKSKQDDIENKDIKTY